MEGNTDMANNKILHVVPVGAVIPKNTVYYVEEADIIGGFQSGCDVIQQKDDKVRYTLNPLFVELPTEEGSVISVQGGRGSIKYFKVSDSRRRAEDSPPTRGGEESATCSPSHLPPGERLRQDVPGN